MTLIKSISGIRGTLGGRPGDNLTPPDVVKFTAAYGTWLKKRTSRRPLSVVIGRDARPSGPVIGALVTSTLTAMGIDVTDLGMATTPTVEIAVQGTKANGGIIITASHNPAQWNALKMLNERGEFLSSSEGEELLEIASAGDFEFATGSNTGKITCDDSWGSRHIEMVADLSLVDREAIRKAGFKIVADCINSVGGIVLPVLFEKLGVKEYILINGNPDGKFAHNPEPLPENLKEISGRVVMEKAHLGIVVDPDVDRLAIVCGDGSMFGEEYTLVAVADYVLSRTPGNTVSNMSSTRALRDITEQHGGRHFASPVGEINVIEEMKRRNAVIGGEGNGGIIYPALHYGRDALAGIALFLTHLALKKTSCETLRKSYPEYVISKNKIEGITGFNRERIMKGALKQFPSAHIDERDGILVETPEWWIQVRPSNTEPVIRIYAEGRTSEEAEKLAAGMALIVKNA